MHGWALMFACRLCCWPLATVLACSTQGLWPPKGSAEDSPHATLQHAKVARDPFALSPPAALKDAQAERCFRVTGKLLAYLFSPTFCISR